MVKHLELCKLDEKRFQKLIGIIDVMLVTCKTPDDLIKKFADKCYGKEKDRKLAKQQARNFLEVLFGSPKAVIRYGPVKAVRNKLKEEFPNYKNTDGVKVEELMKRKSVKFSSYLHETEGKDIEKHRMWTRKLNQYLVGPTLGVGGTAKVKLAYDTKTQTKVALKILKPKYAESAEREIKILQKLNHKNVVRVYDYFSNVLFGDHKTTVFAIEYANQGELIEYLMYTSKFEDDLARWFFISLTEGIEYCHGQNIIHRDLKHDNCLLGENFVLKITDFGFATHYTNEMMKTAIGTAQYAAPEILKGRKYDDSVDIFSMGVMLFIALAGSQPWRKASAKSDRWFKMVYAGDWKKFFSYHERSHKFTTEQKKIIQGLLEPNPAKRWNLKEIKRCSWYKGKSLSQDEVGLRLKERKKVVDDKKFKAMNTTKAKPARRNVDIFSKELPYTYFRPPPTLSFVTETKAEWVLEDILNVVISELKGTIIKQDSEKYKMDFQVTKQIDSGNFNMETRTKEKEEVRICGSVQMWTFPGQKKTLEDRENLLTAFADNKESMSKEEIKTMSSKIPAVKSIAIFRSQGGDQTKYLFPGIYMDILEALPADLISREDESEEVKEA